MTLQERRKEKLRNGLLVSRTSLNDSSVTHPVVLASWRALALLLPMGRVYDPQSGGRNTFLGKSHSDLQGSSDSSSLGFRIKPVSLHAAVRSGLHSVMLKGSL